MEPKPDFAIEGSIVDVRKLMSQLERSEKARGESEARAGDYLKSLNDLKEASEKHNSIRDKLQVRENDGQMRCTGPSLEIKAVKSCMQSD